jgi:hypothetical protein
MSWISSTALRANKKQGGHTGLPLQVDHIAVGAVPKVAAPARVSGGNHYNRGYEKEKKLTRCLQAIHDGTTAAPD